VLGDSVGLVSKLQMVSPGDPDLLRAVNLAIKSLNVLENRLRVHDGVHVGSEDVRLDLRSKPTFRGASLVLWGKVVVTLWQVVMGYDTKSPSWDELTPRLLVWRCIVGEKVTPEGEWARRGVIRNLRS